MKINLSYLLAISLFSISNENFKSAILLDVMEFGLSICRTLWEQVSKKYKRN